jgi:hypothetical protein
MSLRLFQLAALLLITSSVSAEHWAFQPLKPGKQQSIDAYLQNASAPRADARTLIRRAHVDLTGLPASDVSDSSDLSDKAYARLIDSLLASPHYGEQWARHWLDIARYSDTKGYVYAREEKNWVHASAYRDWVVQALNADMPYDRFLLLQIAADQVVPPNSPDLAAMGFLTLGRRFLGVTHDIIDDRIDVVMRGTQALTVACARCHDHKFDPIPTRDYYALYGVFQSSAEALSPCSSGENAELTALVKKNHELMTKRREEQMARTRSRASDYLKATRELEKYPEEVFGQILDANDLNPFIVHRFVAWLEKHPGVELTEERLKQPDSPAHVPDEHIANTEMYYPNGVTTELWKAQGEVDRFLIKTNTAPSYATILKDREIPSSPRVFNRGNPLTKGETVPRQFLSLFGPQKPFRKGSGRLEFAQAIIDPRNPLTARVMVNRIWQHHFGRGLVSTPSDFGKQGSPPTHPELLDFLANEFIRSGWSFKHMHRLIMLSEVYRRTSFQARSMDELGSSSYALFTPHRLSFEEARDAWLAAAGRLNLRLGGRPEPLFATSNTRRTLYAFVDRENLPAVMRTFDFANPDLSIPVRSETTVPQQALFGLNHPFLVQQAKALIKWSAQTSDNTQRIQFVYQRLFQRNPSANELASALAFISVDEKPIHVENERTKAWQHGFGEWDEKTGRVKSFMQLPHFTGHAWQGDETWPNAKLGWAQLTAEGGHPGNNRQHAVVRRWIAPTDGRYDLCSTLIHEPKVGDGIRAFVSHSRLGKLLGTKLHGSKADLSLTSIAFQKGDTLDFIVDIDIGLHGDEFFWSPQISKTQTVAGSGIDTRAEVWDAKKDFTAPPKTTLTSWEQLAQVLMLSNEFMFVD